MGTTNHPQEATFLRWSLVAIKDVTLGSLATEGTETIYLLVKGLIFRQLHVSQGILPFK